MERYARFHLRDPGETSGLSHAPFQSAFTLDNEHHNRPLTYLVDCKSRALHRTQISEETLLGLGIVDTNASRGQTNPEEGGVRNY